MSLFKTIIQFMISVFLLAGIVGCGDKKSDVDSAGKTSAVAPSALERKKISAEENADALNPEPNWKLKGKPQRIAFSSILVSYKGALRADPSIIRTKEAAAARAEQLHKQVATGADFGVLAKENSDGPEQKRAGHVGVILSSLLPSQMATAILALEEGGISEPVETPFGFQILRRDKLEEVYASQIIIGFKGAKTSSVSAQPAAEFTRSRQSAVAIANQAFDEISSGKISFEAAYQKYSESPHMNRNGLIGRVPRGVMEEPFGDVVFTLAPGAITRPIASDRGVVILRRMKEISAKHILITHRDTADKRMAVDRSPKEAASIAEKILAELKSGSDFTLLAMAHSDCPTRSSGGNLGEIAEGVMSPEFDKVAFSLNPKEMSGLVESENGYHIILRIK